MSDPRIQKHPDREVIAPESPEEQAEADALREALERWPDAGAPEASALPVVRAHLELAVSLRNAVHPEPIDSVRHERILVDALASRKAPSRRGTVLYAAFGAAGALAVAAAAILLLVRLAPEPVAHAPDSSRMVSCRSAAELFDARFPVAGGTSERVDRIALARERDFRHNLFERWQNP